ncbi:hypothetical protein N7528_009554 [Penicillium herquei]|nr:hypothetical protein N7528_009554 [Penicillium herquei]
MHLPTQSLLILALALFGVAHPGEDEAPISEAKKLEKRAYHSNVIESYSGCAKKLAESGVLERADLRRRSTVERHRRDLVARQQQQVLGPRPDVSERPDSEHNFQLPEQWRKSHLVTDPNIGLETPENELFADNGTCVLNPEGMIGPFYVTGEFVRSNITEEQAGVPMIIDAQFIDVETCEPVEGVWWDVWSCNATGVYSGVLGFENGNQDDKSVVNATFLRGIQQTDSEGVAQFQTIFPGHYNHRATHMHVVAHVGNVTQLPNNTITGGTVAHIGQLFWDQDLVYEVEETYPYNTNTMPITPNAHDRLFFDEIDGTTSDPTFNFVRLGDNIEDGIFAWVSMAVNVSASFNPSYSWRLTDHGDIPESGGDSPI